MSHTFMAKLSRLKCVVRLLALSVLGAWLALPASAMQCPPTCCCPAAPKPKWHSVVMPPRTNLPAIHFYNKINPIWWFGNVDEPRAPDWYRPHASRSFRNVAWYFRNPLSNFSNYVIGIGDKKSVRSGKYPTQISKPRGGWNFAVSHRHILYLPFIDYKRGRFEFYFGWRERGNFGVKLNFWQAPPRPRKQTSPNPPSEEARPLEFESPHAAAEADSLSPQTEQP